MDLASIIGLVIGGLCLGVVFTHASHGHYAMFYSLEGVLMVFGGSISVTFMALPMDKVKSIPAYIRRFLFNRGTNALETMKLMTDLSEKARRDGMLALENDIARVKDRFLSTGLRMAVDGTDPDVIESTLRLEILAMQDRHKAGKKFFDLIKLYGPGWGLVATLVGQVGMFGNLRSGDIGTMGEMLAIAVVATMYGALLANAVAGPIGDKLSLRSSEEIISREMILQGVLSIQGGDNPRMTQEKMMAFIPQSSRLKLNLAA